MNLANKAVNLLINLIQIPSFSENESDTAEEIIRWFKVEGVESKRVKNNIWAKNKYFDQTKPTILLNSHHDTVKPNEGYTVNPFDAICREGKVYGLGSNDAGASLVCLMSVFIHFYHHKNLTYNLIIAATAEEENSGPNGIKSLLPLLPEIDFAVVGEPTEMQLAIAEKGLIVIDGYAQGIAGHAAHDNTENAIYKAIEDINWIKSFEFSEKSAFLGITKMSVTQINAGKQHNIVPGTCHFVIDVRVNEYYSNEDVFKCIDANTTSKLIPRSLNLKSSSIPLTHPIVKVVIELGLNVYGSPTLSDQANLKCPSLKLGPGKSSRSHSANEFIYLKEIEDGITTYINLFNNLIIK